MFEKTMSAIEPFILSFIILAGACMAGIVDFSDKHLAGWCIIFFGILLTIRHVHRYLSQK